MRITNSTSSENIIRQIQLGSMVLNIVTLRRQNPVEATANLIAPLIVNRRTPIGRQLVISNYSRYSAHHAVVENPQASEYARTA